MNFTELNTQTAFQDAVNTIGEAERLVVCGSQEDKQYIDEAMESSERSAEDILAAATSIDVLHWFKQRQSELESEWGNSLEEILGQWLGESKEKPGFSLAFDMLSGQAHKKLIGATIETTNSWEILAHFKYGDWNDCPSPELHCAIWRYWQEKYGAHIVGVSNDVVEAYIINPPNDKEAAMELAIQHYLYCSDIVDQGVETVSNLAASLMNHHAWYFWWD